MKNLIIAAMLILMSCNTDICGTCRTYVYEFNKQGDFRKAEITEVEYCNDQYKSEDITITLDTVWFRKVQKECK